MIIKIEFTVKCTSRELGEGFKFSNVLLLNAAYKNVCITEPIITVSSLYDRRFHQWQLVTRLS